MVAVHGPVGRVKIDEHVGIVCVHESDEGPRLGGIQLHVIAVQVEALGVGPLAHAADRSMLTRAVVEADPFVAVRVVDGRHEQDQRIGPVRVRAGRQFPDQHEQGFLAADLPRVDVRLDEYPGLAGPGDFPGGRVPDVAVDDQGQFPAFGRVTEFGQMEPVGSEHGGPEKRHDLFVPRGLVEIGALRPGLEFGNVEVLGGRRVRDRQN